MKCHKIRSENIFSLKHRCHLPFHRTKWRMKITQKCAYLNQSPAPWGPTGKPKLSARHTLCLLPWECRAEGAGKSLKGTLYSAPYFKVTSQISGHSTLTDGLDGIIFIVWMEEAKIHRKEATQSHAARNGSTGTWTQIWLTANPSFYELHSEKPSDA